jgi:hypothetical protein
MFQQEIRKGRFMSRTGICLVTFWLAVMTASSATYTAANVSESAVQAAYDLCSDGDTLLIPPGAATWTSQFTITKAINFIGAGTNLSEGATIITDGLGNTPSALIVIALAADKPVRVATIVFLGGYTRNWKASGECINVSPSAVLHQVRIDHNIFRNFGLTAIFTSGSAAYGVIDHNQFINNDSDCYFTVDAADGDARWSAGPKLGTTNAMYFEDNYCLRDASYSFSTAPDEYHYHQQAAESVIRYNKIESLSAVSQPVLDMHGGFGSFRGTLAVEYYSNTVAIAQTYRYLHPRGGVLICFGNAFTDSSGLSGFCDLDFDNFDGITNTFIWGNLLNGSAQTNAMIDGSSGGYVLGTDYWTSRPGPHNGKPEGVYQTYEPLIYPHPIVTAQDAGGRTNPIVTVAPSSLDFGIIQASTSKDLTVNVQNSGSGILSGMATFTSPFNIVAGGTYSLGAGQAQIITIRYAPTGAGTNNATATFTGGGGATCSLMGAAVSALPSGIPPSQGTLFKSAR